VNVSTSNIRLLIVPFVAALLLSACGGDGKKFPDQVVIRGNDPYPVFANSELVQGENRFALGIVGSDGLPIVDANVHLAFYDLSDGKETKRYEMDAVSAVPARDAGISDVENHLHADGSTHIHANAGEEFGIYTTVVNFDKAGVWGVEIKVDKGDFETSFLPKFNVIERGTTPKIGDDAPRSRNLTAADVTDIAQIDSSSKPSTEMHTATIADTIAAGKPALVLFAVPGYCTSRLCGPEMEIMRKLLPEWGSKVEFIHVEFYKNPADANKELSEPVKEWGLQSEPWFFVIDKTGKISNRFEGPTTMVELEQALQKVAP
jgi:peroxiredoxin